MAQDEDLAEALGLVETLHEVLIMSICRLDGHFNAFLFFAEPLQLLLQLAYLLLLHFYFGRLVYFSHRVARGEPFQRQIGLFVEVSHG